MVCCATNSIITQYTAIKRLIRCCCAPCSFTPYLSILVVLFVCSCWLDILPCWLLSICVTLLFYMLFNSFLLPYYLTALTLYHLATITALYRFISLVFVLLLPWCVAGLHYDNNTLIVCVISLYLVLVGWYVYFVIYIYLLVPLAYIHEKRITAIISAIP